MRKFFSELKKRVDKGEDVVLTTVIASSGSTPRGAGARMLVCSEGRIYGTIGGGAVEHEAERLALLCLEGKSSIIRSFQLSPNQVADLGMICGGAVTVYFQYIGAYCEEISAVADHAIKMIDSGEASWVITDVTEQSGGKISLYGQQSGYYNTDILPEGILECMTGHAIQRTLDGRQYYVEQLVQPGQVYIFGGGHVAQELVPVLTHIGFRCVVLEDRPEFATEELFPTARQVLMVDFKDIGRTISITENDYVVIMTRGHQYDTDIQIQVLRTKAYYIGVIGSASKKKDVGRRIMAHGFTEEEIGRIKTPIGLDIKGETPAEIAISIAGELILKRAERSGL